LGHGAVCQSVICEFSAREEHNEKENNQSLDSINPGCVLRLDYPTEPSGSCWFGFSISGVVTDDAGKPLRGAPVTARIDMMSVSRYTDALGKYMITALKPGRYKITATAYGYGSKTVDKEIFKPVAQLLRSA